MENETLHYVCCCFFQFGTEKLLKESGSGQLRAVNRLVVMQMVLRDEEVSARSAKMNCTSKEKKTEVLVTPLSAFQEEPFLSFLLVAIEVASLSSPGLQWGLYLLC